jgi:hypothetical protein
VVIQARRGHLQAQTSTGTSVKPAKAGDPVFRGLDYYPKRHGIPDTAFAGMTAVGAARRAKQLNPVQSFAKKYPASLLTQISRLSPASCPTEGRLAIVTDAGQDAVDVVMSGARERADE